jgi:hypothetical protein
VSFVACGAVLALACGAGLVRLLPWLVAPNVPLRVCWPFARALGAVAVQTALLVGLPIGFAAGASLFVERGEARALLALGTTPGRLVASAAPRLAAAVLIGWVACAAWGPSRPGRFASELIERGRASCIDVARPKSHWVPLVNVTWLCFPGAPPRAVGPLPGVAGRRAWFSARAIRPADDLRSVELDDLALRARAHAPMPELSLRVAHAKLTGLSAWGASSRLSVWARATWVAITGSLLALFCAWLVIRLGRGSRLLAAALGGLSSLAALGALHTVDRAGLSFASYALVPAAGLGAATVLAFLVRRLPSRMRQAEVARR